MTQRDRPWRCRFAAVVLLTAVGATQADAADLIADLTDNAAQLTTGFSGVRTVLFGVVEGGGDIIVVVRGPARSFTVREKRDVAGLWLNRSSVRFDNVPAYYAVLATKPLADLLSAAKLAKAGIGLDTVDLQPEPGTDEMDSAAFRRALLAYMTANRLLLPATRTLELNDGRLFTAPLELPAAIPAGDYAVEVFLVRRGAIAASLTLPLAVVETGLAAAFRQAANSAPVFNGLLAVASAASIGWLASIVSRRGQ